MISQNKENQYRNTPNCNLTDITLENLNLTVHEQKNNINYLLETQNRYEDLIESLYKKIKCLNEEISSLSKENLDLNDKLIKDKLNYDLKLQKNQEKNEIKTKYKSDNIDFLLKDLNCKSVAIIAEKLHKEYENRKVKLKLRTEKEIKACKTHYEHLLQQKENQHQDLISSLKSYNSLKIQRLEKTTEMLFESFKGCLKK
jgi:hypothetical protein